jgi:hypothetical protein
MSLLSIVDHLIIAGLQFVLDKKKTNADSKRESAPYVLKPDKGMIATVFDFVTASLTAWQTGQPLSDRKQIHSAICRHQSPL